MSILVDSQIKELCQNKPMISPFVPNQVRINQQGEKILSYGLSSAGYDVRLADEFRVFTNINNVLIDPLNFDQSSLVSMSGDVCILPPNSYMLGSTIETFDVPDDIMVLCVGKSSYARAGVLINVTPMEPGFVGNIVIEVANCTSLPVKIYAGHGIAQFVFFKASKSCDTSYATRAGKYQGQKGIQLPIG